MKHWSTIGAVLAALLLGAVSLVPVSAPLEGICGLALIGAVFAAVHHARVVAYRVGKPLGTLVLALTVTIIETSLIVSVMLAGGDDKAVLARDTVYAVVMIGCNGVIGLCILLAGIRHREQTFRIEGTGSAYAALIALSILALVLPGFTISSPGRTYTATHLVFAALAPFVLWGVFVFVQTMRPRKDFLPPDEGWDEGDRAVPPMASAWVSVGLLLVSLVGVVGLAKVLSPSVEAGVKSIGAPDAVISIAIAVLVLLPDTTAATRAAGSNRLQSSMNFALGLVPPTIGLTLPAVVVASQLFHLPVVLGLAPKDVALLFLTFLVGGMSLGPERTSIMQGGLSTGSERSRPTKER